MAFADLTANLNLNIRNFSAGLNRARSQYQSFASDVIGSTQRQTRFTEGLVDNYNRVGQSMHYLGVSARDVARIFSGIIVSQAFYGIARQIGEATSALWEFNEALDYAHVTYTTLMGSTDLSTGFLNTLQQFSVDTMFGFKELEGMSRKLLAYGIEYKNLMYVVEGLTNLGTLSGDSAALERLAVAIGQINAKGTLKAEEIRQLTNAYVPMYDILRDKLGLTDEQLKGNIGDLGISSADAINAIVEYSKDKFGDMANAAMYTIKGLNERIKDSLKVMGAEMIQPMSNVYKILALELSQRLEDMYDVFKNTGVGGVFEYLVPDPHTQQVIREFLATIVNGFYAVVGVAHSVAPFIRAFIAGIAQGFTLVGTLINGFLSVIAALFHVLGSNVGTLNILSTALFAAGFAFGIFVTRAIAAFALRGLIAIFTGLARAVMVLTVALLRNPLVGGLVLIAGILAVFATRANNANSAFSNLIKTLSSFSLGGTTAEDILQPTVKNPEKNNAADYWEHMTDGVEDAQDALDKANEKAKKAQKSLLSFDEVFRLNDKDSSSDNGYSPLDMEDFAAGFEGLGDALIPEIPSFKDFAKNFVGNLYNDLWEALRTIVSGATSGALIGGLIGFAIGGLVTRTMSGALAGAKLGATIGAVAGAAFAGFWSDVYKDMEKSLFKIGAGGLSGALLGGLVGFVLGAFVTRTLPGALNGAAIGASIGTIIGGGLGSFWALMSEEMNSAIEGAIVGGAAGAFAGGLLGLVIGAFVTRTIAGALYGAKLGALIGGGVGAMLGNFWSGMSDEMKRSISNMLSKLSMMAHGAMIGALVGMVIGAFAGGLPGAMRGAKIGAMVGGLIAGSTQTVFADAEGGVKNALEGLFDDISSMGYAALIGGLVGMIIGGVVGAFVGGQVLLGAKAGAMLGSAIGGLGAMAYKALVDAGIVENITTWFGELGTKVSNAWNALWDPTTWKDAWTNVKEWFGNLGTNIGNWFTTKKTEVKTWWNNLWAPVTNGWSTGWSKVTTWFSNLGTNISTWFTTKKTDVKTWWTNLWEPGTNGWSAGWNKVTTWFTTFGSNISTWFTTKKTDVKTWWTNLWEPGTNGWSAGWSKVTTWFTTFGTGISNWFTTKKTNVKTWWTNLWEPGTNGWSAGWSKVTTWFSTFGTSISNWFTTKKTNVKTWWGNLWEPGNNSWATGWSKVTTWFSTFKDKISEWFTNRKSSVSTWWGNLWEPGNNSWTSGWSKVKSWFSTLKSKISEWFTGLKSDIGTWWDGLWNGKTAQATTTKDTFSLKSIFGGHATGGVFNREHIARFAEGNKAEAIIPLENNRAMQPFVDAVSTGLLESLAPTLLSSGGGNNGSLPPMYVGTLIADENGLKELYRKFEVIQVQENARKGLAY